MPINANDLMLFAQVIEAGSFSKAATRAGLPKSTLSRRVSSLESELGERLLTRNTRQLVITELGEQILEHARRVTEEIDAVSAQTQGRQHSPEGLLRVSFPPDFDELDLPALIERYLSKYPKVRLEIDISARRVDLLEERFDLAVRVSTQKPQERALPSRKICEIQTALYASPEYLKRSGEPSTPDDLDKHSGLGLMSGGCNIQPWILTQSNGTVWRGSPSGPIVVNSPFLLRDMALRGLGITGLSEYKVKQHLMDGRLARVLPLWQLPTFSVWCVLPTRRLLPSRTSAFIEMLRSSFT
jgi:DNA-binding transcriptional LysR family regulator